MWVGVYVGGNSGEAGMKETHKIHFGDVREEELYHNSPQAFSLNSNQKTD